MFSIHFYLHFAVGFSDKCKATLYWRSIRTEKTSIEENMIGLFRRTMLKGEKGRVTGRVGGYMNNTIVFKGVGDVLSWLHTKNLGPQATSNFRLLRS